MKIDYTKYTVSELLDVQDNIDQLAHPERYQLLCEEINFRKSNGEYNAYLKSFTTDESEDEDELIIEFSKGHKSWSRRAFIGFFALIHLIVIALVIPKYLAPSLSDMTEYKTDISHAQCNVEEYEDSETDRIYYFYDLNFDVFSAINIGQTICQKLAKALPTYSQVSIWQSEGYVYQLAVDAKIVLPYEKMKKSMVELQTDGIEMYLFLLIGLWFIGFKSLANAIKPASFTKD